MRPPHMRPTRSDLAWRVLLGVVGSPVLAVVAVAYVVDRVIAGRDEKRWPRATVHERWRR